MPLQQVGLHGHHPRRKLLLKLAHKKTCKEFAKDILAKSMNYWNHVLWCDESKVNLFDSDGVQHVWRHPGEEYQENCALPTVKHGGGSSMVWACMTTAGTGSCGSLRETWIPTCTVTFWSRRWYPPFRNCFPTQPPQTYRQDDNCLVAEGEGGGVAKYVSRPKNWGRSEGKRGSNPVY